MTPEDRDALRRELYARMDQADIGLIEAVRMMRRIANKTQVEYARMVGVSPRVLAELERGVGNPGLRTLEKIVAPFHLELTVRRRTTRAPSLERLVLQELARLWRDQPGRAVAPLEVASGTSQTEGNPLTEADVRRVMPSLVAAGLIRRMPDGRILLSKKGRAQAP